MFGASEPEGRVGSGVSPPMGSTAGRSDKVPEGAGPSLGVGCALGVTGGLGGPPRRCRAMMHCGQGID